MCLCVRERESDLCALTLMRLRKSKYAPQLSELHGVNKNKVSVFMHLLPFDGDGIDGLCVKCLSFLDVKSHV